MEKRKVHIEDFFTADNEVEGKWFEPKIDGIGCGFEFLVTGATTDEAMADDEHYDKLYAEADEIRDPIERQHKKMQVDAERCARLVKGIRAAEDCEIDFNGGQVEFSRPLIEQIFLKSPLIKKAVDGYATKTANFINREKNA